MVDHRNHLKFQHGKSSNIFKLSILSMDRLEILIFWEFCVVWSFISSHSDLKKAGCRGSPKTKGQMTNVLVGSTPRPKQWQMKDYRVSLVRM